MHAVNAAATFNPVDEDPKNCPFKIGPQNPPLKNMEGGYFDKVWPHTINRIVFTLGYTCTPMDDPLWTVIWPSKRCNVDKCIP